MTVFEWIVTLPNGTPNEPYARASNGTVRLLPGAYDLYWRTSANAAPRAVGRAIAFDEQHATFRPTSGVRLDPKTAASLNLTGGWWGVVEAGGDPLAASPRSTWADEVIYVPEGRYDVYAVAGGERIPDALARDIAVPTEGIADTSTSAKWRIPDGWALLIAGLSLAALIRGSSERRRLRHR